MEDRRRKIIGKQGTEEKDKQKKKKKKVSTRAFLTSGSQSQWVSLQCSSGSQLYQCINQPLTQAQATMDNCCNSLATMCKWCVCTCISLLGANFVWRVLKTSMHALSYISVTCIWTITLLLIYRIECKQFSNSFDDKTCFSRNVSEFKVRL